MLIEKLKRVEISVRPRKRSAAICSRCHQSAPGYDQLPERRFEFIAFWGFFVFLLYAMRRVDCRPCGAVAVEEVPWGDGKRTLTRAYMFSRRRSSSQRDFFRTGARPSPISECAVVKRTIKVSGTGISGSSTVRSRGRPMWSDGAIRSPSPTLTR